MTRLHLSNKKVTTKYRHYWRQTMTKSRLMKKKTMIEFRLNKYFKTTKTLYLIMNKAMTELRQNGYQTIT